jgi:phosphoglycerate dehydrogenase-like enzyme
MSRFERIHVHLSVLADFANDPVEQLLGDREFVVLENDEAFIAALPDMEVVMGFRMPRGHWAAAEHLKFVQVPGAGVDSIVSQPDLTPDAVICNATGAHDPEMSEFIMAMIHATTYRVPQLVDQQRAHRWRPVTPTHALAGGRLCVLGLGTIGQSVAARAAGIGMEVVGVRNSGRPVEGVAKVVTPPDRLEAIAGATALVVLTPLTDDTRGMVGPAELAALAPGAIVVDVSRGGVMDIDALTDALASGHIAGAAVDVFDVEPLPKDSELWDIPNLLVTPHTAGSSDDYARRISRIFAANLLAFERGETPPGLVDRSLGY